MTITYRGSGPWGSGKGAPLTAPELDGNFHNLDGRVTELEENPEAVTPTNVTQEGNVVTLHFSNNETFTFTLPSAAPAAPVRDPAITDSTFTPGLADINHWLIFDTEEGTVVTLQGSEDVDFPIGSVVACRQRGFGPIIFAEGSGVTFEKPDDAENGSAGRGAVVGAKYEAEDRWVLFGDLEVEAEEETS